MNRSLLIAGGITVAAVLWVLSGQFGDRDAAPANAAKPPAAAETLPMQVRVTASQAVDRAEAVVLQGRTEPSRSVVLKAEIHGRVVALPAARGARVRAGDVLVRFDAEDRGAQLSQARALVDQRKLEHEAAQALNRRGHATDVQLATARALLDAAQAQARRAEIDIGNLEIRAPFDGVLEARAVELGDFLDVGKPAATVVDLDPLWLTGFATETHLAALKIGAPAEARLLGGGKIAGHISFIAATAESGTRTFRIEVEADNPDHRLAGGLTAQIILPLAPRRAHFLPASALSLADDGAVGVKAVDDGNRARFIPVEVLGMAADGVWLGGLPDALRVIVVGQEFVAPGVPVRPVEVAAAVK